MVTQTESTARRAAFGIPAHLYPFEGHYLDLDGLRYHYVDEGEGDPVVMVHGNPTWSLYYRELIKLLRKDHRVIVPDHIGCGLSDKPSDDRYEYTFERRVDDLETLLDHLGITENVTLIVHDWGGMIGGTWAHRHPERIKRLIVLNTAAFHLPQTRGFHWQLKLARNTGLGDFLVRRFNAFSYIASHTCTTREPMSRELRRAYRAPYNNWENRIATIRFVQDIPLDKNDKGYKTISDVEKSLTQNFGDTPTLICWGHKDFVFDHHFLARWKELLPQAEVHEFPDCGHYILEDASQEVQKLVSEFIQKHPIHPPEAQA